MTLRPTADMSLDRLRQLLAAYGADARRWPDNERDSATALIAGSAVARDLLAEADALDAALSAAPADVPDAALARLTAATAFPPPRNVSPARGWANGWSALSGVLWPRAAVFATVTALGILTGLTIEPIYPGGEANAMVLSDLDGDMGEDLGI